MTIVGKYIIDSRPRRWGKSVEIAALLYEALEQGNTPGLLSPGPTTEEELAKKYNQYFTFMGLPKRVAFNNIGPDYWQASFDQNDTTTSN